jgi:hypothetical protein
MASQSSNAVDILSEYPSEISMPAISLKLPAELLLASGRGATALGITRAEYIRRAIDQFNRETEQAMRNKRLADASHRVRDESIRVNAEFDAIDDLRRDV